jgi:hypothetical protein
MPPALETGACDTGVTMEMKHHDRYLGRLVATVAVVIGLAACGRASGPGAAAQASTLPGGGQTVATDAAPSPDTARTEPTPVTTVDLPDLSGITTDLNAIDQALADDASAVPAEGSDK